MAEEQKESDNKQQQAEKIKMLAALLGGGEAGPQMEEIIAMMELAEKLQPLFVQETQEEKEKELPREMTAEFYTPSREVQLLRAAMPFLDNPYQKTVFVLTKMLEICQAGEQKTLQIASEEGAQRSKGRPVALLKAIRPYLLEEERRQIDGILRFYKMRELMRVMQILSKEDKE